MKTKFDRDKAKKVVEKTASTTVRFTKTMFVIIFILIIFYTVVVTILVFLKTGVEDFLTNVATISVGGFWAFFLGYFGWRMGENIEAYFSQIKKKR